MLELQSLMVKQGRIRRRNSWRNGYLSMESKIIPVLHARKTLRREEIWLHAYFFSALDGG
jgi:hypothetical protein